MGRRGPKPKPPNAERAKARGYYRPSRHGPLPETPQDAETRAIWDLLKLENAPRPRPLGPIEEVLEREGIEITDADRSAQRKPKTP